MNTALDTLFNGAVSLENVKTVVTRAFGSSVELIGYQLKPFSSEKNGFLAHHASLRATVKRSSDSDDAEERGFFVKIVPDGSTLLADMGRTLDIYEKEYRFYGEVLPALLKCYTGEAFAPKCYLANERVIVLEDLREKNYAPAKSLLLQGELLESAARAQARLHAASLLAERESSSLGHLCPMVCRDQFFNERMRDSVIYDSMFQLIEYVAKIHARSTDSVAGAFERAFRRIASPSGRGRAICHDDNWSNNMLFDDSSPPKCVLVDYQFVKYGERAFNLAKMVYLCTTRETREREEAGVVEAYHRELCDSLTSNGGDRDELPSLEEIREEYEEARLAALFAAIYFYPYMHVSEAEKARYAGDYDEFIRRFIIKSGNESIVELMQRDKAYEAKIFEIVLEFIETCDRDEV